MLLGCFYLRAMDGLGCADTADVAFLYDVVFWWFYLPNALHFLGLCIWLTRLG